MKKFLKRFVPLLFGLCLFIKIPAVPTLAKTPVLGSTVTNQCFSKSYACEYDRKIYYTLSNSVYSIEKDGTDKKTVCQTKEDGRLTCLTVLGGCLYAFFEDSHTVPSGTLIRINIDGTGYKIYSEDKFNGYSSLCTANGKLYYRKHSCIYSMKPDGLRESF